MLLRPKMDQPCRKNRENMDLQFEKDKEAFERRANAFRKLSKEKYHHNRVSNEIIIITRRCI